MTTLFDPVLPLRLQVGMAETAARLLMALAAGLVLGIDRELRSKPAGLRSHMLVSLSSASLSLMTFAMIESAQRFGDTVRSDPVRLLEAVVAGVAFLGAGTIIQGRNGVSGITTGASLWLAGAVGIACGIGHYQLAMLTVALAFLVLYALGKLEAWLGTKDDQAD